MCGICGWLNPTGVDPAQLVRMNNRAAHRGPDGEGYWLWRGGKETGQYVRAGEERQAAHYVAGLGHRRLAILDLSDHGCQPMAATDGRYWIVFNGEIYNYIELRTELVKLGFIFHTGTDTEVILAAYVAWGNTCFNRFNGMWGLAIVDLVRRKLVLSRDRLGIKPLYYWAQGGALAFASEIKQLLTLQDVSTKANLQALTEYIETGYEQIDQTFFAAVKPFPAGCWAEVDLLQPAAPNPHLFWSIERRVGVPQDEATVLEKTRFLFEDAVRLRLRSDVPVGVCLSGGLDSSAIYGQMHILSQGVGDIRAFSAAFEDPLFDERPYIAQVIDRYGGQANYVFPTAEKFLADCDDFIDKHDEPPGSLSQYAAWDVMRLARSAGVPVLLNGQGGDELFSGYWSAYYLYLRQTLYRAPWHVAGHIFGSLLPGGNPQFMAQLMPHLRQYLYRAGQRSQSILKVKYVATDSANDNWAYAAQVLSPSAYRAAEITHIHLPRLLKWDDRNSMAFGIEGRYPFLDYRLVEWITSLPPELNLHNGWNKLLVRHALGEALPDSIRWRRTKIGFVTPQSAWISSSLRPVLMAWCTEPSAELGELIDAGRLHALGQELLSSESIHRMDERQFLLMRLFFLDCWLRAFHVSI